MFTDHCNEDALNGLANEFVERMRRGENLTLEQLVQEYPDFESGIRELLPTLQWIERLDPAASPCERETPLAGQKLGEYTILRQIGHGGMGTVYEAVHQRLGRHVALKVLTQRQTKNGTLLERFQREAKAAATLHHTNVVPIFEVGEAEGYVYYAMQLVYGHALDQVFLTPAMDSHVELMKAWGYDKDHYSFIAKIGVQVADALAHAHAAGVLHRDIKPANILIEAMGNVWIADFGLAQIDGMCDLTSAGEVIGTLRYIPPENFSGRADARGDIYSLGLTLYELLARKPLFAGSSRAEVIHQILNAPPCSLRSIDRHLPKDLETIIATAIARDPNCRYPSASALMEDLRRFCAKEPIHASRLSTPERIMRWCRQHRALTAAAVLTLTMLLLLITIVTFAYYRENRLRNDLQVTLEMAVTADVQGRQNLFDSYVASARTAQLTHRPGQRFDSLSALHKAVQLLPDLDTLTEVREERKENLRDLAIAATTLPDIVYTKRANGEAIDLYHLDRSARRDESGNLIVRQWPSKEVIACLSNVNEHTYFEFTPNRDELLLLDQSTHTLHRWKIDQAAASLVTELHPEWGKLVHCSFSHDGRRVLLADRTDDRAWNEVLDWPQGKSNLQVSITYDGENTPAVKLSPDGKLIATIEGNYRTEGSRCVRIISVDTRREVALLLHDESVESTAWYPDSQTLAVGLTDSNDVVLWNVPMQRRIGLFIDQRGGGPKLCSNRGELLSSSSTWGSSIEVWHASTKKSVLHFSTYAVLGWTSNDGRLVGDYRLDAGEWQMVIVEPSSVMRKLARNPLHGSVEAWRDLSLHKDGRILAVGSDSGISLFDLRTGQDIGYVPVGYALHPWFVPDTGDLLTYSEQGLSRWPVTIGNSADAEISIQARIGPPEKLVCPSAFGTQISSDDSGQLIAAAAGAKAYILHRRDGRLLTLGPLLDCRQVAVSHDGKLVVTSSRQEGSLVVWDADTGEEIRRVQSQAPADALDFSRDGRYLSFITKSPQVLDLKTWQISEWDNPLNARNTNLSDGRRLVVHLQPGSAMVREVPSGRKLAMLATPDETRFNFAAITEDNLHVILNSNDTHATYIWDLRKLGQELEKIDLGFENPPWSSEAALETLEEQSISLDVDR